MRPMRPKPLIPTLVGIAGSIDEVVGVEVWRRRSSSRVVKKMEGRREGGVGPS